MIMGKVVSSPTMSAKAELARRVLETLAQGHDVSTGDALQLRNWAGHPKDSVLPLEVIARRILDHEAKRTRKRAARCEHPYGLS
jgi:hypothetical protein